MGADRAVPAGAAADRAPRSTDLREVVNAILYMATTGCQWRMLPKDLPPPSDRAAVLLRVARQRIVADDQQPPCHGRAGDGGPRCEPDGGRYRQPERKNHRKRAACGYDAGKKIKGRKRHIVAETLGLMVGLAVHAAGIQDRDGAPVVLNAIRARRPWLRHIFADGGYAGPKLNTALRRLGDWTLEIVKRSDKANGFQVLPRRWVVERTFAWLGRCRRLAKEWEKSIASAEAWVFIAHIRPLSRRLAR